jgi:hypothetical protein
MLSAGIRTRKLATERAVVSFLENLSGLNVPTNIISGNKGGLAVVGFPHS